MDAIYGHRPASNGKTSGLDSLKTASPAEEMVHDGESYFISLHRFYWIKMLLVVLQCFMDSHTCSRFCQSGICLSSVGSRPPLRRRCFRREQTHFLSVYLTDLGLPLCTIVLSATRNQVTWRETIAWKESTRTIDDISSGIGQLEPVLSQNQFLIPITNVTYVHMCWIVMKGRRLWIRALKMAFLNKVTGFLLRDGVSNFEHPQGVWCEVAVSPYREDPVDVVRMPPGHLPGQRVLLGESRLRIYWRAGVSMVLEHLGVTVWVAGKALMWTLLLQQRPQIVGWQRGTKWQIAIYTNSDKDLGNTLDMFTRCFLLILKRGGGLTANSC